MINIKPFKGYRPIKGLEEKIACKPYDIINYNEAKEIGEINPISFVHIIRPEIDMPEDTNPYSPQVYEKTKENLKEFIENKYIIQEEKEVLYIYRQIRKGREQNGIVGCISIDDYGKGKIKKHEFTRFDKEEDRINHFYAANGNTEPVFLFHKENKEIEKIINEWTKSNNPVYDFVSEDDVRQILWIIDNNKIINNIKGVFNSLDSLYIADGHHRTASSYKVGLRKREENPDYTGEEEYNYFMSVIFPEDQLYIMAYNRLIKDLNGYKREEFLEKLSKDFSTTEIDSMKEPKNKGEFVMALEDKVYKIVPKEEILNKKDLIDSLDVSILQNHILNPILGIKDPRADNRIEFVGGEDMLNIVKNRLNTDIEVAFLLYPTDIKEIINVSDIDKTMPPKSTWFEPKLMSGLFIHMF